MINAVAVVQEFYRAMGAGDVGGADRLPRPSRRDIKLACLQYPH